MHQDFNFVCYWITGDERSLLQRNPKFAIPDRIDVNALQEELERAYSIMRMELRDEEEMGEIQGRKTRQGQGR